LQTHPDKGGTVESFRLIQDAFEMLTSKIEDEEAAKKFKDILFDAQIRKGGPGVGLGMVVVEDVKTNFIIVKRLRYYFSPACTSCTYNCWIFPTL